MKHKRLNTYSLQEISAIFGLTERVTKAWIKTHVPGIYDKVGRKNYFTSGEFRRIIQRFDQI